MIAQDSFSAPNASQTCGAFLFVGHGTESFWGLAAVVSEWLIISWLHGAWFPAPLKKAGFGT